MKLALAYQSLTLLLANASTIMPRSQDDSLKSRAEQTNYEETSRYEDVMRFIGELQKRTDKLLVESFGQTEEGRDLPLMIFADPPITQPREARASRGCVIGGSAKIISGRSRPSSVWPKDSTSSLSVRFCSSPMKRITSS